jgi:hypothetical protein
MASAVGAITNNPGTPTSSAKKEQFYELENGVKVCEIIMAIQQ